MFHIFCIKMKCFQFIFKFKKIALKLRISFLKNHRLTVIFRWNGIKNWFEGVLEVQLRFRLIESYCYWRQYIILSLRSRIERISPSFSHSVLNAMWDWRPKLTVTRRQKSMPPLRIWGFILSSHFSLIRTHIHTILKAKNIITIQSTPAIPKKNSF